MREDHHSLEDRCSGYHTGFKDELLFAKENQSAGMSIMSKAAQNKTREILKRLAEKGALDHNLVKLLYDLRLEFFLIALENEPFDQVEYFTKLCNKLKENVKLTFACLIIYKTLTTDQCLSEPNNVIKYGKFKFDPRLLLEFTSKILEHTRVQLDSSSPFFIDSGSDSQYLFHVPIIRPGSPQAIKIGELNFWLNDEKGFNFPGRYVRRFADLLGTKMEDEKYQQAEKIIDEARALPNEEIEEVIETCMNGVRKIFGCSYSVGLVLNRYYSEGIPNQFDLLSRKPPRTFEVVKEELCGKYREKYQKSKATGLWVNENEGLLAELLIFRKEKPEEQCCCLTFHQITLKGVEYKCIETEKICKSLRASEIEENEKTVIYAPLNIDGMQLGFMKLSYDETIVLSDLEKRVLRKICDFLAKRIQNSFIYSLNVDQLRFLPQIKSMFEGTDNFKLLEFDQLHDMLAKLTDTIIDITGIDNVAFGYITKDSEQKRIIRFTHPRGWSESALKKYSDLEIGRGLSGLAVRIKRDVYLAPVEMAANIDETESTVYVNEQGPIFVDTRKSPEYKANPAFKKLAEYYIKTTEEKIYANFVFLVKYKETALGVINVEVTEKSWDRFMGLVYVHFFKTLADQLALFFYKLRLAKEDLRISRSLEELSKFATVSSTAAYKAVLFSLSEIFGVPKMRISSCDRKTGEFHFKPPRGSTETLTIGFTPEEIRRLSTKSASIRLNDFCLSELKHHIEKYNTFYLYIPSIDEYVPNLNNRESENTFTHLKENPEFVSYMGILLGEKEQNQEVLELFSNKRNAFDELVIDHSFFASWISQIKMAMKFALEIHTHEPEQNGHKPPLAKSVYLSPASKVIPLLPGDGLNLQFGLVGIGKSMEGLKNQISKIVKSDCPTVLILGETGTGKGLVARAIHLYSRRKNRPFVAVHSAALPESVVEFELFGYEKGAFPGASKQKRGKFELAHEGTIFLDEIGNISSKVQVRLLRVLQEKEFERVGGEKTVRVDVRVITATNRNLREEVEAGRFRDDLWYRINAIEIKAVPLRELIREREDNLLEIISYIIHEKHKTRKVTGITRESYKRLLNYSFPGNVRELEGIIQNAVIFNKNSSIVALNLGLKISEKTQEHRKLAAIMFTDMVGYSALTHMNEPLALELLEEQRHVLRSLFPKYGGKEVETVGDAFFVEFSSALEAVRCAVEIQKTLFDRNISLCADEQIRIRIGVHIGDVIVRGRNVLGDMVNIAARLEPLAEPGGICISEDVARQIQNKIELPLHKLPKTQLKNISRPMDIYSLVLPWMESRSPCK